MTEQYTAFLLQALLFLALVVLKTAFIPSGLIPCALISLFKAPQVLALESNEILEANHHSLRPIAQVQRIEKQRRRR